jgi:hypothetical protein
VAIYLPVLPSKALKATLGIRDDLYQLARENVITLVSAEFGPTLLGSELYALRSQDGTVDTASARLFKDFYPQAYGVVDARLSRGHNRGAFEIWWGLPPDKFNCERHKDPCDITRYSILARIFASLAIEVHAFGVQLSGTDPVSVPYTPYAFADEVLKGNLRSRLEPVLKGKFVFYGADLIVPRDNHPNPVFGYRSDDYIIPGVFVHAMAFENLVDLRESIKSPRPADRFELWVHNVVVIGIVCISLFAFRLLFAARHAIWDTVFVLAMAVIIASVQFFALDRAPSNWVEVFALIGVLQLPKAEQWIDELGARLSSSFDSLYRRRFGNGPAHDRAVAAVRDTDGRDE